MPSYPKFSSDQTAADVRGAVISLYPHRHLLSLALFRRLMRYYYFATSSLLPKKLRMQGVRRIVNQDMVAVGYINDDGRVLVGQLVPTLDTPESRKNFGGFYISDLPHNAVQTIDFRSYSEWINVFDDQIRSGRLFINPLTATDSDLKQLRYPYLDATNEYPNG